MLVTVTTVIDRKTKALLVDPEKINTGRTLRLSRL